MMTEVKHRRNGYLAAQILIWPLFFVIVFTAVVEAAELPLVENGGARAVIVVGSGTGPIARRAAQLLQSRVEWKTGTKLAIVTGQGTARLPRSMVRIVIVDPAGQEGLRWMKSAGVTPPRAEELGEDGFSLRTAGQNLFVVARRDRGWIFGVGTLLHTARYGKGSMLADAPEGIEKPKLHDRVLYLAIHCDNFYEVQPASSIYPIIEEAALWGVNGVSVWLDQSQYNDPFNEKADNADVRRVWNKEKQVLRFAQGLGLKPGYVMSANDIYKNQASPAILAKGADSWNKAPLADPTKKDGLAVILRDKANLFQDAAKDGIKLDNVLIFPYDTGGCFSEDCRPWIMTFLKLAHKEANLTHRYFPGARVYITDWHCTDNEAEVIIDYLNLRKPSWLAGIWKDDRHPMNRLAAVDPRFDILAFEDITMIGGWGTIGANPFPARLQTIYADMMRNKIKGYMAYSEGIFDDFNKAMSAQLAWNPNANLKEIEREYSNYFFSEGIANKFENMVDEMEAGWSNRMAHQARQKFIESPENAARLADLAESASADLPLAARDSWRWQVLAMRAKIGLLAVKLREQAAFRKEIEQDLKQRESKGAILRIVQRKELQLNDYRTEVAELRSKIYKEPMTRYPPMIPNKEFMEEHIQVAVPGWEALLENLHGRLAARNKEASQGSAR